MHPLDEIIAWMAEYHRQRTKMKFVDAKWLELLKIRIMVLKVRHPELPWPVIPWEDFPKTPRVPKLVADQEEIIADKIVPEKEPEPEPEQLQLTEKPKFYTPPKIL